MNTKVTFTCRTQHFLAVFEGVVVDVSTWMVKV